MDFLIRKVMTETEYEALKSTLKPTDGVVVVSDSDPTVVVTFAIGSTSFTPAGASYAPDTATFVTTTDETTAMPNSVNLGALSTPNGATGIMLNKPVEFGVAVPAVLDLTDNNPALLFIANNGTPQQSRFIDFTATSGATSLTFTGMEQFTCDATSGFTFDGSFVSSDFGFEGNILQINIIESLTPDITFRRNDPLNPLTVNFANDVDVDIAGPLFVTLTSSAGTDLVQGAGNQIFLKTSSRRFKENIEPLEITEETLTNLLKLEPVTYTYKNGSDPKGEGDASQPKRKSIGLVAEEVNELFPELVNLDDEGLPFSINYDGVGVLLINAIKQLKVENDILASRLSELEEKLA